MVQPTLVPASDAVQAVNSDLKVSLNRLASEGLLDIKVTAGRKSSTQDKLWVMNNVLRRNKEGFFQTEMISG